MLLGFTCGCGWWTEVVQHTDVRFVREGQDLFLIDMLDAAHPISMLYLWFQQPHGVTVPENGIKLTPASRLFLLATHRHHGLGPDDLLLLLVQLRTSIIDKHRHSGYHFSSDKGETDGNPRHLCGLGMCAKGLSRL